jgi:transposase
MLEKYTLLERGIVAGRKAERLSPNESQLTLALLGTLLARHEVPAQTDPAAEGRAAGASEPDPSREKAKPRPTGRKPLPQALARVEIEVLPDEVKRRGLDAYERIGEDVCEVVERRSSSLVVVRTVRPKFVLKGRERREPAQVQVAAPLELPIERGLAGPALLADTIVRRWQDHLPLHRMESIYAREGLPLARSTICRWHAELAGLLRSLVAAMAKDARGAAYLCMDATGVLVQAKEKCKRGHFWVIVAPELHVLFRFSARHTKQAVDEILGDYQGYLVVDAHTVYDHLFLNGKVIECGCWSHCRRYFFKALPSDPQLAREGLAFIGRLFEIERQHAELDPKKRCAVREQLSRPVVEAFFAWCEERAPIVLDETPIAKAVQYARNHRAAFERFLQDGRLPLHNNGSELQLRRQAIGRKNWLFLGSESAAEVNTTFVSLLASCQMHGIEPCSYLRDLFCLLPGWPASRVLELAPAYWKQTLEQPHTQQRLVANPFRSLSTPT